MRRASPSGAQRRIDCWLARLPNCGPGTPLTSGAVEGRNAIWLAEHGWDVTAVDFSAVGLAKARAIADERRVSVDWFQADLVDYRPSPRSYDLVVVLYLHLLPDERRVVLRRASEALLPGGTILVIGHDLDNLSLGIGGPRDPTILYTPDAIAAELGIVEVERAIRVTPPVDTGGEEREAIDTLVRSSRGGLEGDRQSACLGAKFARGVRCCSSVSRGHRRCAGHRGSPARGHTPPVPSHKGGR